jgi:hypothetical protein
VHFFQTIPEEIVDRIPDDLRDRADEIVSEVQANPTLMAVLVVVGVLTALLFVWGVVKQAFKAALFAGLASAGVWYWYFNIR